MLDDGAIDVVITEAAFVERLGAGATRVVCLDRDDARIAALPASNPDNSVTPDNLAYVLYTSGSTGEPKGVMVEHRAVVALLFGVDYVRFDDVGSLLHMAPLAFDAATFEIWGALLHGRRSVVYTDRRFLLDRFGALMREEHVDTLWLTAALFNIVIDESWSHLTGVQQLVIGGEALSTTHVAKALRLLPELRLVNGYGPTETTTFAACFQIRDLAADRAYGADRATDREHRAVHPRREMQTVTDRHHRRAVHRRRRSGSRLPRPARAHRGALRAPSVLRRPQRPPVSHR